MSTRRATRPAEPRNGRRTTADTSARPRVAQRAVQRLVGTAETRGGRSLDPKTFRSERGVPPLLRSRARLTPAGGLKGPFLAGNASGPRQSRADGGGNLGRFTAQEREMLVEAVLLFAWIAAGRADEFSAAALRLVVLLAEGQLA